MVQKSLAKNLGMVYFCGIWKFWNGAISPAGRLQPTPRLQNAGTMESDKGFRTVLRGAKQTIWIMAQLKDILEIEWNRLEKGTYSTIYLFQVIYSRSGLRRHGMAAVMHKRANSNRMNPRTRSPEFGIRKAWILCCFHLQAEKNCHTIKTTKLIHQHERPMATKAPSVKKTKFAVSGDVGDA